MPALPGTATPAVTAATPTPATDGFVPLFNGRDLTGWTPMRTSGVQGNEHQPTTGGWTVHNNELVCNSDSSGWLKSERQYDNFVLQLEFKLRPDGNSGVYIRSPGSGRLSRTGMEIQITDEHVILKRGHTMQPNWATGAIYDVAGTSQPPLRPMGEWNLMEIRCQGDDVEVMLNGTRTASANMSQEPKLRDRPRSGYIGIANWPADAKGMAFRNIRIKDLSTKPAATTLTPGQGTGPTTATPAATTKAQSGQPFITSTGMELVWIPPGEFMMGSTSEEQRWADANGYALKYSKNEGEQPRKATIKQGYWLGRTEVTVGQWKQFVAATGHVTDAEKKGETYAPTVSGGLFGKAVGANWKDPNFGFKLKDNHPACCISWNDAVAFCKWLNDLEQKAGRLPAGFQVRLPAEVEWEYACRAGTQTKFWWGDTVEGGEGRLNWRRDGDGFRFVSPVDHYGARGRNKFGLADMLGNVWEWCCDEEYDIRRAQEGRSEGDSAWRVMRGGSFLYDPSFNRCANREVHFPNNASAPNGFRVAVGPPR
jgi:formylglycine-generating enzyme required for sulfatase activity